MKEYKVIKPRYYEIGQHLTEESRDGWELVQVFNPETTDLHISILLSKEVPNETDPS
jgi:hypothetical protein